MNSDVPWAPGVTIDQSLGGQYMCLDIPVMSCILTEAIYVLCFCSQIQRFHLHILHMLKKYIVLCLR